MPGPSVPHDRAGWERYVLDDFTGGMHSEGIFSKTNLADNECACAQNVEFWPPGTISKRKGRTCKNSTLQLSGAISNIYQWFSAGGASHIMIFTAASGYGSAMTSAQVHDFTPEVVEENTFTYILSSGEQAWNHDLADTVQCASMAGSAFFVNGRDFLFAWNGLDVCSGVENAPKGAKAIATFMNFMFLGNVEEQGGGTRHDSRIYWSNPSDPHDWPASQWLDFAPEDGTAITALVVLGNELIVFKENKIWAVSYVGGSLQFVPDPRINDKGCVAGSSIFQKYNYIGFYGSDGFYRFDGRTSVRVSDKVKDFVLNFDADTAKRCFMTASESHTQAWALVPLNAAELNAVLVWDYDRDNWTYYNQSASCMAGYIRTADKTFESVDEPYEQQTASWGDKQLTGNVQTIMTGSYNGYIYYNESDDADEYGSATSAISAKWISKWIDFGFPDINKRIMRVSVFADSETTTAASGYYLHLKLYKDYDPDTVVASANIALSGTSVGLLERRLDTTFGCRTMAIEVGTDAKDEYFRVHRIVVEYMPKGRTLLI